MVYFSDTELGGQRGVLLNQSQSGIYIDTGLGSAANTVIPANAGIQGTVENVLSKVDTGLRRRDEGFCSFRLHNLTQCRLPKRTLEFGLM